MPRPTARSTIKPVAPPKGGDWTEVVSATPAGGFVMGNPNAKVKLIEYGSLTCPHCREFDENGVPPLIDKYVKSGQVSYEFRNYVRDAFDLTASLVARCNGAKSFFPLTRALYKDQPTWVAKIQARSAGPARAAAEPAAEPAVRRASRRSPASRSGRRCAAFRSRRRTQCLTNEKAVDQLVQMTSDATDAISRLPGHADLHHQRQDARERLAGLGEARSRSSSKALGERS